MAGLGGVRSVRVDQIPFGFWPNPGSAIRASLMSLPLKSRDELLAWNRRQADILASCADRIERMLFPSSGGSDLQMADGVSPTPARAAAAREHTTKLSATTSPR